MTEKPRFFPGIELLRAIFSFAVVGWHNGLGVAPAMLDPKHFPHKQYLFNYIYSYDFSLLAVPVFLVISNFLFLYKGADKERLISYAKKYVLMYLFWIVIVKIFTGNILSLFSLIPKNPTEFLILVVGGPFGAYFFFVSLIFTYIISFLIKELSLRLTFIGLLGSLVITYLISYAALLSRHTFIVYYYMPVNFISVPFCALFLNKILTHENKRMILILVSISAIMVSILEYLTLFNAVFLRNIRFGMPDYERPSLYIISMLLIYISLRAKTSYRIVSFLGRYSLAIYVLHPLFIGATKEIVNSFLFFPYLQIRNLLATVICIILSLISAKILSYFFQKYLIYS